MPKAQRPDLTLFAQGERYQPTNPRDPTVRLWQAAFLSRVREERPDVLRDLRDHVVPAYRAGGDTALDRAIAEWRGRWY